MPCDDVGITETVPGMRPGSHLWNLLVAVAYLVFAPVLMPLAFAVVRNPTEGPSTTGRQRPR